MYQMRLHLRTKADMRDDSSLLLYTNTLDLVQTVVNVAAYFVPTLEFQSFQDRIVINITATVEIDLIVNCSLAIV